LGRTAFKTLFYENFAKKKSTLSLYTNMRRPKTNCVSKECYEDISNQIRREDQLNG